MKVNIFYFIVIFFIWNTIVYCFMWSDKNIARNEYDKRSRKSEAQIFFRALIFGFLGVGLGMLPPLRHKTNQFHFRIGVPFLAILNVFFVFLLQEELVEDYNFNFYYDHSIVNQCLQELEKIISTL